jgi:hypothetical protein
MKKNQLLVLSIMMTFVIIVACKKGGDDPPPPNPCAGVSVQVQGTKTDGASVANPNGSITITQPVGSGITYSINGGAFVATTTFANLTSGNYTVTAKNANGCTGTAQFTITAFDPCAGKNFSISSSNSITVAATPCIATNDGSLTAVVIQPGTYTFNLNGGAFQSSGVFSSLAPGTYTVGAKDVDGCVKTGTITVPAKPAGPLFAAVRTLIQGSCAVTGCHSGSSPAGTLNFTNDCTIVSSWDRIKARAVDNIPNAMPPGGPLTQADKDKITAWINAGHMYTN